MMHNSQVIVKLKWKVSILMHSQEFFPSNSPYEYNNRLYMAIKEREGADM